MLLMARGTDDKELKKGQLEGSVRFLAKRWRWGKTSVERFLEKLENSGRIRVGHLPGHLAGQITICKYKVYHGSAGQEAGHLAGQIKEGKRKINKCSNEHSSSPRILLDIFNEENKVLPTVREFTPDRQAKSRTRLKNHRANLEKYLEDFRAGIRIAQRTPFLRGEGTRQWQADFDWFIHNDSNLNRVLEGKYGKPSGREVKDIDLG